MGLIQSFVQRHEQTHEARYRRIWNRKGRSQVLWVDWIFSRLDFSSFRGEKILPFGLKLVKKIVFPPKLNYWSCEKHLHLDDNISHEWKSASKIAQKLSFLKIELLNREILVDNFSKTNYTWKIVFPWNRTFHQLDQLKKNFSSSDDNFKKC